MPHYTQRQYKNTPSHKHLEPQNSLIDWLAGDQSYNPQSDLEAMICYGGDFQKRASPALQRFEKSGSIDGLIDADIEALIEWKHHSQQQATIKKKIRQRLHQPQTPKPKGPDWKPKGKKQKERSAAQFKAEITAAGLSFRKLSQHHYRIHQQDERFDFWPTTGKWWEVGTRYKGQGIKSLLEAVQ